ncbi:ABC-2 type transporter [Candidatus Zixiibacteriota bacterium]|nr:ABC-2 type transporter [candidate division Zixibacteria bacterium]
MIFSRVYAVFLRQLYLIRNNPTRLASIFLWLLVNIIMWGFISKYLGSFGKATFNFVTVILGAIILWEFVTRIQQGMMTSFLEDIWTQNFVNFFASPLKIIEYLSGLVLNSITTGLLGFFMVTIIAGIAFGYNIFKIGLLLIPAMAILFVFGISMGIVVSGLIFRLGPTAEWLGWPIPMVLSLFSGVFYPVATLPPALRIVADIVPASYVFETVRAVLSNSSTGTEIASNLLIGAALVLVYLAVAYILFIRVYARNLKNGAIAQFSAESF